MSVIDEITAERRRQVEQEGWSDEHDDSHRDGEMSRAAACYAAHASAFQNASIETYRIIGPRSDYYNFGWPWSREWWKPKDPRRDLVRAAALIVAEIERLDRLSISSPQDNTK